MSTLETARTLLRPLTTTDFADVHKWSSAPDNVKYMDWGPNTKEDTMTFLAACEKSWAAKPIKKYEFGIILKETGDLIGACGIYKNDELRAGELGWILHRDYWKRGIMTEAACELIRFGFEALHLHRVFALCNAENRGSYRVMELNKMRREGHYVKSRLLRNVEPEKWCDVYNYAMLEEEYFNA